MPPTATGFRRVMGLIPHRRLRRDIDAYVDDELDAQHRATVRDHLERCPDCSAAAKVTMLVKASLAHMRQPRALAAARLERWAQQLPRR